MHGTARDVRIHIPLDPNPQVFHPEIDAWKGLHSPLRILEDPESMVRASKPFVAGNSWLEPSNLLVPAALLGYLGGKKIQIWNI
eukprot:s839_g12.t1